MFTYWNCWENVLCFAFFLLVFSRRCPLRCAAGGPSFNFPPSILLLIWGFFFFFYVFSSSAFHNRKKRYGYDEFSRNVLERNWLPVGFQVSTWKSSGMSLHPSNQSTGKRRGENQNGRLPSFLSTHHFHLENNTGDEAEAEAEEEEEGKKSSDKRNEKIQCSRVVPFMCGSFVRRGGKKTATGKADSSAQARPLW